MKGAAPASSRKELSRQGIEFVQGCCRRFKGGQRPQQRCVAEHRENWDLMSAAASIKAIDDPVPLSSGDARLKSDPQIQGSQGN